MRFEMSKIKNFVFFLYIANKDHKGLKAWEEARHILGDFYLDNCNVKVLPYLMTLSDEVLESVLVDDPALKEHYDRSFARFSEYFDKNVRLLEKRKGELKKAWSNFDKSKLEVMYDFYGSEKKEPKVVYLFAGNFHDQGLGYHYHGHAFLFCSNLGKEGVTRDLRILMHEFCHLIEHNLGVEDKNLKQNIAFCFAPYGYLFEDLEKIQNKELYLVVKKAIQNRKTFKDIESEIVKIYSKKDGTY
ncbi:MAG: hypothetical protein V1914_00365 [archaeon]